jgi:alpha/beta superfamily hydrolase
METPGYLGGDDEALAYVRHVPKSSVRGAVLMVPALAIERTHSYLVSVRWARALCAAGFEVLRFDLRGTGESGGDFAAMHFGLWREDVLRGLAFLRSQRSTTKLFVHGLRAGALLATQVLEAPEVDGLLTWAPPQSGRAYLMEVLRRKLAADYAESSTGAPKTRAAYIERLESGQQVEVEGSPWSKALWESAQGLSSTAPPSVDGKPRLALTPAEVEFPRPPFWQDSDVLKPKVDALFEASLAFLFAHTGAAPS